MTLLPSRITSVTTVPASMPVPITVEPTAKVPEEPKAVNAVPVIWALLSTLATEIWFSKPASSKRIALPEIVNADSNVTVVPLMDAILDVPVAPSTVTCWPTFIKLLASLSSMVLTV